MPSRSSLKSEKMGEHVLMSNQVTAVVIDSRDHQDGGEEARERRVDGLERVAQRPVDRLDILRHNRHTPASSL
jgi:hypothetical protein